MLTINSFKFLEMLTKKKNLSLTRVQPNQDSDHIVKSFKSKVEDELKIIQEKSYQKKSKKKAMIVPDQSDDEENDDDKHGQEIKKHYINEE